MCPQTASQTPFRGLGDYDMAFLKHQSIGIGPESDTIAYFYRTHSLDQLRVCKAYTELASSSITFYW